MSHTAIRLREFIDHAPVLPPGPVIRLGKDVRGFYPGQTGCLHKAHACEGPQGLFQLGTQVFNNSSKTELTVVQLQDTHHFHASYNNQMEAIDRPFCQLRPAPGNNKAEEPFQPDFDNSALRQYVHFQKTMKKTTRDWYQQTSYKAAFDLPFLNMGDENKYTPTTDPGPLTVWTSAANRN